MTHVAYLVMGASFLVVHVIWIVGVRTVFMACLILATGTATAYVIGRTVYALLNGAGP